MAKEQLAKLDKYCPLTHLLCIKSECAWYLEDEGRCAIASLPNVLDWAVRISVTKPYEGEENERIY